MASLSSAASYAQQPLWKREKNPSVFSQLQPQLSSSTSRKRTKEFFLSAQAVSMFVPVSRRNLRLIAVAARRASGAEKLATEGPVQDEDDGEVYVKPQLPGEEPDFWEGPQFEILGFIVQYLWAFGVGVALIACFVAVRFYNEGASDFKETEVYKEAMESQGFVETPSDSKVFEEPPLQDAPAVAPESST
ncbi:hypothetical protein KP509_35G044500 [Ceratopteris richardii]|uniref:Uncharacterized protein n=1 Tax=Ceratopteris richardii TaxID=49495 RepID=A0A8T2QGD8_CERRI|nr:hypothetical protein KP509_35G044500 [Ceratopteris richardii]KAH7282708.1 hypothetical protein KP509_35G044500 [Ceratopteris richardii]